MAAGTLRKREVAQLVIVVLEAQNLDEQVGLSYRRAGAVN